jgi:hypothetical protein
MTRTRIMALIALSSACIAAPSLAAEGPDSRFNGNWAEVGGPQPSAGFHTVVVGKRLKLVLSKGVSPPAGETVWLQRTGPDQFATSAGDRVQARFRSTGPDTANLKMKEMSLQHLHVFDTDLRRH